MTTVRRPWLRTATAAVVTAAFLVPVLWMVSTSFKKPDRILAASPQWIPAPFTAENYSAALANPALPRALLNSLVISGGVVTLTLLLAVPLSYALARIPMRGSGAMMLALLITQLLPAIVLAAPLFLLERKTGLQNTYTGLIAADTTLTLPFAVVVLRPLVQGIPVELEEAALVDGCGPPGVLGHVVLPLMAPGLIAVAGLSFLLAWGEFVFGLTLGQTPEVQPVTVVVNSFAGPVHIAWGPLMATATLVSVPVVCLFAILHRFIVGGLTAGSVKG
ncbi:carbohydrate ABC transporter permease [Streptomyces coffeae]|uniref:Carbohydrate ABC transporter permease n=1 Tax=Streptomyces coffeae TaxID=621382 RepID=A0ABS1NNU2_9ACTN|nr:carbohydrate ABC transporter permease [Streptomyces coffeae]MBL1101761.1 carbohydrate ABC transporter permease [Streptomyces coffeae]